VLKATEFTEAEALDIVPAAVLETVDVVDCSITYDWSLNNVWIVNAAEGAVLCPLVTLVVVKEYVPGSPLARFLLLVNATVKYKFPELTDQVRLDVNPVTPAHVGVDPKDIVLGGVIMKISPATNREVVVKVQV
jgi:hypothetical protein